MCEEKLVEMIESCVASAPRCNSKKDIDHDIAVRIVEKIQEKFELKPKTWKLFGQNSHNETFIWS